MRERDRFDDHWADVRAEQQHDLAVRAWYPAGAGLPPRDDQQTAADRAYERRRSAC